MTRPVRLLTLLALCAASGCDSEAPAAPALVGPACTEPGVYEFSMVDPVLTGGIEALQASLVYPEEERAAGVSGRVVVRFVVETTGIPCGLEIARSVSPGLDRAALVAVLNTRWVPGQQNDRLVPVRRTLPVTFRLP